MIGVRGSGGQNYQIIGLKINLRVRLKIHEFTELPYLRGTRVRAERLQSTCHIEDLLYLMSGSKTSEGVTKPMMVLRKKKFSSKLGIEPGTPDPKAQYAIH